MSDKINIVEPVVSVEWLFQNRDASNLIILDGTIAKVFDETSEQIPKARFFDIKQKFSNVADPFPSAFPSEAQFQEEACQLGINNDSAIIVYDDKGIYSSARVWWLFKAFGYENIAILNGGFPEWKKANYVLEKATAYKGGLGDFNAELQPGFMQFFKNVKTASENKSHTIIDARASERYQCKVPEPKEGLRMGTIPNSVNLPFTDLLSEGKLKSKADIEKAFQKLAKKDEPIIFSCGSGITACVLALGATISGYNNISVYDGSWTEWGSLVRE
ncbi:sulfurtransferase [Tamlana sp. 2_MG-2023]|uniref:sulfurtransferase n=1 Tax=unclassified Tamlana TaxID=2614803 RepID=UPI0026E49253|nr:MULTISPECIES: sulfurtransferase [unclassified Tamlana]MDO6759324.1 sulfurtransferase [Tamlana sp. 2_MG-2023]MDO6790537.1 sulfurtransferase [Tamlana sp. 1_MG-2023]